MNAAQSRSLSREQIWQWLDEVKDPEIPVLSVHDLGIVREVCQAKGGGKWIVYVTPTYSGCPAGDAIAAEIVRVLNSHGMRDFVIEQRISPPWTSDWISERGKDRLRNYGIAPPKRLVGDENIIALRDVQSNIPCPRCDSSNTLKVSDFGSTPCKAHYKCADCLEPFDYFKCI